MTKALFEELYGETLAEVRESVVFAGDSPNDEPMFSYFPHSVGVANVLQFSETLAHKPKWITKAEGGLGFSQLSDHLLQAISLSQ